LIIGKKEYDKVSKMVQRQQNVSEQVSPFYIQMLLNLDTTVQNVLSDKDAKKKLNATKAKALTAMKQKTKKALKEHESEVAKFKSVSCISIFSDSILYRLPESRGFRAGLSGWHCSPSFFPICYVCLSPCPKPTRGRRRFCNRRKGRACHANQRRGCPENPPGYSGS